MNKYHQANTKSTSESTMDKTFRFQLSNLNRIKIIDCHAESCELALAVLTQHLTSNPLTTSDFDLIAAEDESGELRYSGTCDDPNVNNKEDI